MPDYVYALSSALLWAISAPVINRGLAHLPTRKQPYYISLGLLVAMLSGTALLFVLVARQSSQATLNVYVILAGLFTFLIATGLYYFASYAFGKKTELAAQFAKFKPVFSIGLAIAILNEGVTFWTWVIIVLLLLGLAVFSLGVFQGAFSWSSMVLGLSTALAWAIGEVFVKLGFSGETSLIHSFMALASSTFIIALLLAPFAPKLSRADIRLAWLLPFAIHGIISFGLAYAAFFKSITLIGLANTAIINAFWPFLAILLSNLENKIKGIEQKTPLYIWIAAIFFIFGSVLMVITI